MEPIFASISLEDASYLKQQLNIAEEFDKSLSHMFGIDRDMLGVVINNKTTQSSDERKRSHCDEESNKIDALGGKNDMERLDKVTPLFQRLLCALIEEDEGEESYHLSEAKNISRQCTSDDSHCGSCNQIDFEPKDRDRMDSEVESKVDLQIQKNCTLDRLSCDKSTTSNTSEAPDEVPRLHDEQYFAYFNHGLREEVRARVRSVHVANPLTRGKLMNVARAIDMELSGRSRGWIGKGDYRGGHYQVNKAVPMAVGKSGPR
ncbi:uncharacterized protein LOC113851963 [Abrus precatorius]|uniref:Uncharacterized protein LOC113851963 n=1 Tax=Abrus precatorius TaxID=3816 RepID=A0A8B8K2T2_ABRPR|nr:uncharacterized protein LOC113851963 [Abrus precatorius]